MNTKSYLKQYENFISVLTKEIDKMFLAQEEYICCKNGCSLCCEDGMYPFSKIEFEYIIQGYKLLPDNLKQDIQKRIDSILSKYQTKKMYECPFLINKSCTVYNYRGLICRTFGLISENDNKKLTIPYCANEGLNYSEVYNKETHRISEEKVVEKKYKALPKAYNLSRENIMYSIAFDLGFEWGETKPLIEWLKEYRQNLEK